LRGKNIMNTEIDRIIAFSRRPWMRRQRVPTFLFVDLVGFTALTDAQGDEVAAEPGGFAARCAP
jgi:class 3 adenylate cyclase